MKNKRITTKDLYWWVEKLTDLIEKECDLYDKRPMKERNMHPSGECYVNDMISLIEKALIKQRKELRDECEKDVLYKWKEGRKDLIKKIEPLIADEINQARKDGFPTSRLTSLYMRITKIK